MNKILVIVAHPDDEVLGCGATIVKHVESGDKVQVVFLADGFSSRTIEVNRDKSAKYASKVLGCSLPIFMDYPDNEMDSVSLLEITKKIEIIINNFKPNIIYTHHFGDLNIDHQITHRAVMTACRPQTNFFVKEIYSFEILSATHWQSPSMGNAFNPNYFVDVSDFMPQKINALKCYEEEMRLHPNTRSYEAINFLAAFRGAVVCVEYAEAFCVERLIK